MSLASLIGANLSDTLSLDDTYGSAYYDSDTTFTNFDSVLAGWMLVPEPNTYGLSFVAAICLFVSKPAMWHDVCSPPRLRQDRHSIVPKTPQE